MQWVCCQRLPLLRVSDFKTVPHSLAYGNSVFALLGLRSTQHAAEATAKEVGRTDAVLSKADEEN
jgi:hypothetical protein